MIILNDRTTSLEVTEKTIERFWSKVNIKTPEDCWEWEASLLHSGYGRFRVGKYKTTRRMMVAHRFSWMLTNGSIPVGLFILHKCDNRKCVNPNHLFIGTFQDNSRDMCSKGRHYMQTHGEIFKGEKNPRAKHSEESILNIYHLSFVEKKSNREIANLLQEDMQYLRNVLRGTTWKYLYNRRFE